MTELKRFQLLEQCFNCFSFWNRSQKTQTYTKIHT